MQLAMIGLGRMGASMVRRLLAKGHGCVGHDVQPAAIAALQNDGATERLTPHLDPGGIVVDGGNSYYHDDIRRAAALRASGQYHVDVRTSGGVGGHVEKPAERSS
jgi:6-phosphogluconate dehydrogenase